MYNEENISERNRTGSRAIIHLESTEEMLGGDDSELSRELEEFGRRFDLRKRTYSEAFFEREISDERKKLFLDFSSMYCGEKSSSRSAFVVYLGSKTELGDDKPRMSQIWRPTSTFRTILQREIEYKKTRVFRLSLREAWQLPDNAISEGQFKLFAEGGQRATDLWNSPGIFRGIKSGKIDESCGDGTIWMLSGRNRIGGSRLFYVKYEEDNGISIFYFKQYSEEVIEVTSAPTSLFWSSAGYTSCCRLVEYQFTLFSTFQVTSDIYSWPTQLLEIVPYKLLEEIFNGLPHAIVRGFLRLLL